MRDDAHVGGAPFNQAQILHLMKTEFGRARRHGYSIACVLLQVDRVQSLVEIHGPELRDVLRTALGTLVAEKTRDYDHVGLTADDRYLLVLPHTDRAGALPVAERIARAFGEQEIRVGGHPLKITISCGVAACEDRDTLFFDTLVSQAEVALEWASNAGGNRIESFRRERFVEPSAGDDVSD